MICTLVGMARSYEQFCPIARTLDQVGDRWTLLIVRQLLTGPQRFTDLRRTLRGISPTLLQGRLTELQSQGLIRRVELAPPADRLVYELTERGAALEPVLYEIARWGLPLLDTPTDEQPLVPELLQTGIKGLCRTETTPDEALTVAVILDEGPFTLEVLEPLDEAGRPRRAVDRIVVSPGAPDAPDATVRSQLGILLWLRRGDLDLPTAITDHLITIAGTESAMAQVRELLGLDRVGTTTAVADGALRAAG
jgi:DNA-binding HxlR family transcriptional regulator